MKRILALALCAVMLLSAVALLSSCKKSDDPNTPVVSEKTATIDLAEYKIVYDANLSALAKQHVIDFSKELKTATTVGLRSEEDLETEPVKTEDLEILVGQTNRKETVQTLRDIDGHGWAVRVFDNKLVIVGTNSFLTRVALCWFADMYLTSKATTPTPLTVNKKVVLSNMPMTALVDGEGAGTYSIVIDEDLDTTPGQVSSGASTDYAYDLSCEVRTLMSKVTGARENTFKGKVDSAEGVAEEVLVGNMSRPEMKEELYKLNGDQYAVSVRDGKIMLAAWSDATLPLTYPIFEDMMNSCVEEDENGNSVCLIPMNCTVKGTMAVEWVVDFPKPEGEGIALDGMVDVGDNSIEYIYAGDGVNRDSFVAYCTKLENAGYRALAAETQWEGSSFRTYINEETDVVLHVYHAAYKYAKKQGVKDVLNSLRIVAASTKNVTVPDASILSPQNDYQVITQSKVTQLDIEHTKDNWGLACIVTLVDGTFIVIDGGVGNLSDDQTNLWNVLCKLYEDAHGPGATPSDNKPLHIRGWIMTHEHYDHYNVFKKFINTYGHRTDFQFDYLLMNTTSESERYNTYNPSVAVWKDVKSLQSKVKNGFKYLKVHTGQVFYMANCRMEVLYTHEDTYPTKIGTFNNSTSVIRTVLVETDKESGETYESGCVWLGDVERVGSRRMRAMYGDFMKSDMVQVAHHGYNGAEARLYNLIDARVVWVPTKKEDFASDAFNKPNGSWIQQANYAATHNPNVDLVIMSDSYNTTLVITAKGLDYSGQNLYDAKSGNAIVPDNIAVIDMREE